ncbi:hypothetical protein A2U01_0076351, partial [Trifolium medium]|nr:hypothetical protein [Trifolium medium]
MWVDKITEEINTRWPSTQIQPKQTPFVPTPKPKEYKQQMKKWRYHYKKAKKSKFGGKTKASDNEDEKKEETSARGSTRMDTW